MLHDRRNQSKSKKIQNAGYSGQGRRTQYGNRNGNRGRVVELGNADERRMAHELGSLNLAHDDIASNFLPQTRRPTIFFFVAGGRLGVVLKLNQERVQWLSRPEQIVKFVTGGDHDVVYTETALACLYTAPTIKQYVMSNGSRMVVEDSPVIEYA